MTWAMLLFALGWLTLLAMKDDITEEASIVVYMLGLLMLGVSVALLLASMWS